MGWAGSSSGGKQRTSHRWRSVGGGDETSARTHGRPPRGTVWASGREQLSSRPRQHAGTVEAKPVAAVGGAVHAPTWTDTPGTRPTLAPSGV